MSKHYCHQTPGLRCSLEGPGNTCTGGWLSAGHCANRKDYPPAAKSIKQIADETNLSVRQVNGILNSLVKNGEVEIDWSEDTRVYTKGK